MAEKNWKEYVIAGGAAAAVSRTAIAPVERVKIVFQTTPGIKGYGSVFRKIMGDEGLLAFWRGNGVAVVRVVPYLSVQLSSNEIYRDWVGMFVPDNKPVRNLVAGTMAGATSIVSTYPLDTVRARLAVQVAEGAQRDTILGMLKKIYAQDGVAAMYRGCYISCCGGGLYAGLKFASYDTLKGVFCRLFGISDDRDLNVVQRAVAGGAGGFFAQTFVYPFDVIRRRMQTAKGDVPYKGIADGFLTIMRTEGVSKGLFRGLTLNYMKTVPNVAIYLSLYDVFKYYLI